MGSLLSVDSKADGQTVGSVKNYSVNILTDSTTSGIPSVKTDSSSGSEITIDFNTKPPSNASLIYPTRQSVDDNLEILNESSAQDKSLLLPNSTSGASDEYRLEIFGTFVYPCRWLSLATLYSLLDSLSSLAMVIGCVLPYVPQYTTIYKTRNSSGFSTFVCLTLLIANIMRIASWFGKPFEMTLFVQSAVMILAQLLLLELCVRTRRQNLNSSHRKGLFTSGPSYFWQWTDLTSYLLFLVLVTFLTGASMYFMINYIVFAEVMLLSALVIESMLGLPQAIRNHSNKSVEGMSIGMVLMWLCGDSFKSLYFIVKDSPYQFWLGSFLQISIDLVILMQVFIYRPNKTKKFLPLKIFVRK